MTDDETRTEKLSTSVFEDEKRSFRVLAAEHDHNMSEHLREVVYDYLEENGHETSRNDGGAD